MVSICERIHTNTAKDVIYLHNCVEIRSVQERERSTQNLKSPGLLDVRLVNFIFLTSQKQKRKCNEQLLLHLD
jgi:hypothetical protein